MKVAYNLFLVLYDNNGNLLPGSQEFLRRFKSYRPDRTTNFVFNDFQLVRSALKMAQAHKLEAQLFYSFDIAPEEVEIHPGFYLAPNEVEDFLHTGNSYLRHLQKVDLAKDLPSEAILVDEELNEIIAKYTTGVGTVEIATVFGRNWYRIDNATSLPEPIYVPQVMFAAPDVNPPGTYAVQSDGRDILTPANVKWLEQYNLAISNEVRTLVNQVKWRSRYIVSGKLMAQLHKAGIKGLVKPPVPLLSEAQLSNLSQV